MFYFSFDVVGFITSGAAAIIQVGIRAIFYEICAFIYGIIIDLYDAFLALSKARILEIDVIKGISQRVGLILGLVMFFMVSFSFIQMVLDPDKITDKEKGAVNIIKKVLIVIVLFGISPFLFEKTQDIQELVIEDGIINRLLLPVGYNVDTNSFGKVLSSNLFTSFYSINEERTAAKRYNECVEDHNLLQTNIMQYGDFSTSCVDAIDSSNGLIRFVMNFNYILSLVVGIFVVYSLVMYTISVGMRVIQLAFLQMISPMAFVAYLSPKKDNLFSKWLKMYIMTFLDVFIRIAIISLGTFLISILMDSWNDITKLTGDSFGSVFWHSVADENGVVHGALYIKIIMIMAILSFMKKAPELIKQLIPSTGAMGTLSYGVSSKDRAGFGMVAGTAAAAGLAGIGVVGHTISSVRKKIGSPIDDAGNIYRKDKNGSWRLGQWDKDGNLISEVTDASQIKAAKKMRRSRLARGIGSGLGRGITQGVLATGRAAIGTAKDGSLAGISNVVKKQSGINAKYRHAIDRGSTFSGRVKELVADLTGYEFNGSAAQMETALEMAKARNSRLDVLEKPLNSAADNFNTLKNEGTSALEGDTLDGELSKRAQQIFKVADAKSKFLSDNIGKNVQYNFSTIDVGKEFNIGGVVRTVTEQDVGRTYNVKVSAETAAMMKTTAADVKKDMTEVIADISMAAGKGKDTVTLRESIRNKYGFSVNEAITSDEANHVLNNAANHQISDIISNPSNFTRKVDEGIRTIEYQNGELYFIVRDNDGNVVRDANGNALKTIIQDSDGVINYKALKDVRDTTTSIISENYATRAENDIAIKEIEGSEEFMVAKANRDAALTPGDGLKGGRPPGMRHGPYDGPPPPSGF